MHLYAHICRLQDLTGYGVAVAVGKEFANAFPDRTFLSPLVRLLVESGRNGIKIVICIKVIFPSFLDIRTHSLLSFQVKTMGKDITFMRREANQNLILQ